MTAKILGFFFLFAISNSLATAAIDRHVVQCDTQRKVCECRETADECEFSLLIEELHTFMSYEVKRMSTDGVILTREEEGKPFYFNSTGHLIPSFLFRDDEDDTDCVIFDEDFSGARCTTPLTVDGKTYRPLIAINSLIPGPTLVVYEGQVIIANVMNEMITETISIHWHGMHQRNTPWMDGTTQITQCPIGPMESFRYYFKANPTGTFWYHSHTVTQRADGLFGALIIRESAERRAMFEKALNVGIIIDSPGNQTLNLHEWNRESNLDRHTRVKSEIAFFPGKPLGEIPLPPNEQMSMQYKPFEEVFGPDGLSIGDTPFFSGLINGKGRNKDVPYERTRLEIFNVESGNVYRFRLIAAQEQYAYKFSIDEHNLTVISTDGSIIEPVEAQFVILHTGERYDFLLKANKPRQDVNDYWIRAETLEVNLTSGLPYQSLGNIAEGILHYNPAPPPRSTSYEQIKNISIPFDVTTCGTMGGCVAVNCPFRSFHPSYNIRRCINAHQLRMLWPTSSSELPSADVDPNCPDCEFFFNIDSSTDAINGRNMQFPPSPLQTQKKSINPAEFCDINTPCNDDACQCIHVREIQSFNQTIRFVLSLVGDDVLEGEGSAHPMHLHGHHFHVVDIGYGPYHANNGTLRTRSPDIRCSDQHCSIPSWNGPPPTFTIDDKTVRKDTVIVPGGGYVVIHFRSDNPGFWFMHCHIIPDLLEGMAVVINEVESRHNPAPPGFPTCGRFSISQDQFYNSLAFDPDNSSIREAPSYWLLMVSVISVCLYILNL